jgi:SMC interacting uncharacterized protein involved in chromosome segregation
MGVKHQGMNERRLEHVREIREQFFAEDHHELTLDDILANKDKIIRELTEEVEMLRAVLAKQGRPQAEPAAPYTQKPEFDFYRD